MKRRDFLKLAFGALGFAIAAPVLQPILAAAQPVASQELWGMSFVLDPNCPPDTLYFMDTKTHQRVGAITNISIKGTTMAGDISGRIGNGLFS